MKNKIFRALAAALFTMTAFSAAAQTEVNSPSNPYRYTYRNGRTLKINWKPETAKTIQRYTVAINPTPLFNHGLKFDFEYELPRPGEWIQVGLTGYYAPERTTPRNNDWRDFFDYGYYYVNDYDEPDDYNRYLPASGWNGFRKMSGAGVSVLYKKMLHRRGWYLSTGLALNFFRVEYSDWGYVPSREDGLTFYRKGEYPVTQSFFKPTLEFNIGKHFALSNHVFIDLYAGGRVAWSFHRRDSDGYQKFDGMYGFAYRGIEIFHGGVRFGILLW